MNNKQIAKIKKLKKEPINYGVMIHGEYLTVSAISMFGGKYVVKHGLPVSESESMFIEDLETFCKVVSKTCVRDIVKAANFAILKTDGGDFKLALRDHEDVSDWPAWNGNKATTKLSGKELMTLKTFVSKDDLRPAMCGVYIGYDIVATNGHVMYFRELGLDSATIIPGPVLDFLEPGEYTYYHGDTAGRLVSGDEEIHFKLVGEEYPKYHSVIPKMEPVHTLTCKAADLDKYTKHGMMIANSETGLVRLKAGLHVTAEDIDMSREYKSPAFGSYDGFDMGFNGKYLTDLLKLINPGTVNMNIYGPNKAAIVNDNMLLMPVMLNTY